MKTTCGSNPVPRSPSTEGPTPPVVDVKLAAVQAKYEPRVRGVAPNHPLRRDYIRALKGVWSEERAEALLKLVEGVESVASARKFSQADRCGLDLAVVLEGRKDRAYLDVKFSRYVLEHALEKTKKHRAFDIDTGRIVRILQVGHELFEGSRLVVGPTSIRTPKPSSWTERGESSRPSLISPIDWSTSTSPSLRNSQRPRNT
jgi:hypothetical protein